MKTTPQTVRIRFVLISFDAFARSFTDYFLSCSFTYKKTRRVHVYSVFLDFAGQLCGESVGLFGVKAFQAGRADC